MLALMKELHAQGKLTPAQQFFMAPRRPEEELYDVLADPWEISNLAGSPEHQTVLKQMRSALDKWIADTDDQGRIPESPQALKTARERHSRRRPARGKGKPGKRLPKEGALPREGWKVTYVDSQETRAQDMKAAYALDGKPLTCWHTQWQDKRPDFPHEIRIDLGAVRTVRALQYLPRQDRGQNGRIRTFEVYVSRDGEDWGKPVAAGQFKNSLDEQQADLDPVEARLVRLVARSGYSSKIAAVAEINVLGE